MTLADAQRIVETLRSLSESSFLKGTSRYWWPKYVYHYTDVRNAVKILTSGRLLSRSKLEGLHGMPVDNASPEVIRNTRRAVKDYVRLYFRPRTPTQYHNEGIRPPARRTELKAHCPIPVFFLFDSTQFFLRTPCYFSEGNLAAPGCMAHKTAKAFTALPFEDIYHEGPIGPARRRKVVFHRNAEIIVPDELSLGTLKYLFCRSPAEKETLLGLLPTGTRTKWETRVVVDSKLNLFFRTWTFVESARLATDVVSITFSPDSEAPGPFDLEYRTRDLDRSVVYSLEKKGYSANEVLRVRVPANVDNYRVEVRLGSDLAYRGIFNLEVPF